MTRRFLAAIHNILQEVEVSREAFQRRAREFLDFYRSHIKKEEEVFFPAALKMLTKEDWAEISEVREIWNDPIFGPKSHERLETLREGILAWSGATST